MLSIFLTILFTFIPTLVFAQDATTNSAGDVILNLVVEYIAPIIIIVIGFLIFKASFTYIGSTEVGLLNKRFSKSKLSNDNLIAFNGEAGYQANLLMPGWRFALWPLYNVIKKPWVQIPAGEFGLVISQIGESLNQGQRTATYKELFGSFTNLEEFIKNNGQKGVQRKILLPGALLPLHPVAFIVITRSKIYGIPADPNLKDAKSFGLDADYLKMQFIPTGKIGIVTSFEGSPLQNGDIAGRIGDFADISTLETDPNTDKNSDETLISAILSTKNTMHENYQDAQKFIDAGGKVGLQHDPLLTGAYAINPAIFHIEEANMLTVEQGEVAVVKSYVGLPEIDVSPEDFKFGSLVRAGHRGVWREPLGTGKYALNPKCYSAVDTIVPTSILTLNWSEEQAEATDLDVNLKQIKAKSKEGFPFALDLEVQIHVPDNEAPHVICMVKTIRNMVDEVLQAAVGNHFRDKFQSLSAVEIIEQRQKMQTDALDHISDKMKIYHIETRGVYIQNMELPGSVTEVLQQRLIANERKDTFAAQQIAEEARQLSEKAKGMADAQADLAKSEVAITVASNKAESRKKEADGEAYFNTNVGQSKGAEIKAVGLAKAEAYKAQQEAIGQAGVIATTVADALSKSAVPIMPNVLVTDGNGGGGFMGLLARYIENNHHEVK